MKGGHTMAIPHIIFDGIDTSQYFTTEEVSYNLLNKEIETVKVGGTPGERVIKSDINKDEFTAKIFFNYKQLRDAEIKSEFDLKRKIAELFHRDEPRPFIYSKDPNVYINVIYDGTAEIEFFADGTAETELSFTNPDGFTHALDHREFMIEKDEEGEPLARIVNNGTVSTPLDIHTTFLTDADAIGFVNEDITVQFGTTFTEDESDFVASERVIRDGMGPAQKNEWKLNVGRPRFKYGDEDTSSKVRGNVRWEDSVVRISDYGTIKDDDPGYWHGPTLTRNLSTALDNFTAYFRFKMKPGGKRKNRPKSQGLLEINLMDADNNFVMGFGLKDNDPNKAAVMYDFFVGDYRVFRGNLPKKVLNYTNGIFGYIELSKVGNQFTFKLCHLKDGFKENWSVKKSIHNDSVAMLNFKTINFYGAQWKRVRDMITEWTSTTITKVNTEDDKLVPLVFYEGDELFVDGQSNRVYINGIRDDNYRVIGSSQFLAAPPGNSEYSLITDGQVEGYLEMRERYL